MIWVEILSRHREVAARFPCAGPEVRIGRGYDNDVILDDPYVAARHVRVFRDEAGRLVAEDGGSANGMFLERDAARQQRIVIDGEQPIRIGHTRLRIREAGHAVAPERVAGSDLRSVPVLATALGAALLAIEALTVWLSDIGEPKVSSYLGPLLTVAVAIAAWVGVWALLARSFSGRAHFQRNLVIALLGALAFSLYSVLGLFSAFALTWRVITDHLHVALWCILGTVCFFHLREVSSSRLALKGGVVATLFALVIAVQALYQSEALYNSGRQTTMRRLLPPSLRLAPLRDEATFFAGVERLKRRLDSDRLQARADDVGQ